MLIDIENGPGCTGEASERGDPDDEALSLRGRIGTLATVVALGASLWLTLVCDVPGIADQTRAIDEVILVSAAPRAALSGADALPERFE